MTSSFPHRSTIVFFHLTLRLLGDPLRISSPSQHQGWHCGCCPGAVERISWNGKLETWRRPEPWPFWWEIRMQNTLYWQSWWENWKKKQPWNRGEKIAVPNHGLEMFRVPRILFSSQRNAKTHEMMGCDVLPVSTLSRCCLCRACTTRPYEMFCWI